ncbi:MAG: hypothetical protein C0524_04360 [Rhodobacter sp.]|nr:hypothetical protein [Rhodobacter sp.]
MALAGTGRLQSVFLFGVSGPVAAAIALTQSRGGFICLLVLSILALRPSRRNILIVLGSVPVLGLLLAPLVPAEFTLRVMAAFSDVKALVSGYGNVLDTAIAGRVSEMLAAWHVFLERPWLGSGYATFESLYQDTARRYDLMARGADRQAHNLYLEILAETGLAGLLAYASMIAFAIFSALAAARRLAHVERPLESAAAGGLALSILGCLLSSVFLLEAFQWYLWMMVALAVAAPAMHRGLATAHAEN